MAECKVDCLQCSFISLRSNAKKGTETCKLERNLRDSHTWFAMEKNCFVKDQHSIERMYHFGGSDTLREKTFQFLWKPCAWNVWETFARGVNRERVSLEELTTYTNCCEKLICIRRFRLTTRTLQWIMMLHYGAKCVAAKGAKSIWLVRVRLKPDFEEKYETTGCW